MPMFEGKEYPYTDEGMAQLWEARKRRKQQEEGTPIMSGFLPPPPMVDQPSAPAGKVGGAMLGPMGAMLGPMVDQPSAPAGPMVDQPSAPAGKTSMFEAAMQRIAEQMEGGVLRKEDEARHLDRLQALIDRVKHRAAKEMEGGVLRKEDEEMYNSIFDQMGSR